MRESRRRFRAAVLSGTGLAQAQDAAAGEKVFAQCRACHQIGPTAKNGGRARPERPDRPQGRDLSWLRLLPRQQELGPDLGRGDLPRIHPRPEGEGARDQDGLPGLKNEQQITDLIAFLKQYDATGQKSGPLRGSAAAGEKARGSRAPGRRRRAART